jgi:hypothetical protein
VAGAEADVWQARGELVLRRRMTSGLEGAITPELRAGIVHEEGGGDRDLLLTFGGASATLDLPGDAETFFRGGVGLTLEGSSTLLKVDYDFETSDERTSHTIFARLALLL